jgi:prepilin-type N-terminal cleavage/methylation domain-containing protein
MRVGEIVMRTKKGFTMIELLAVIVIIAIIAIIIAPSILHIIDEAKKGVMERNAELMAHAATFYTFNNMEDLPKEGQNQYIFLSQLYDAGYMKKIYNSYDPREECSGFVRVSKKNGEFEYTPYLDCGGNQQLEVSSSYIRYGGIYNDTFTEMKATTDGGFIVVGHSNSPKYSRLTQKNADTIDNDALIVKYSSEGKIEHEKNFGGDNDDFFNNVIEVADGYIAVGFSISSDNDLSNRSKYDTYGMSQAQIDNLESNIGSFQFLLVKYDKNLNVVDFRKYYTTNAWSNGINDIKEKDGNFYIVGSSDSQRALIMKLDSNLNMIDKSDAIFDRNTHAYRIHFNQEGNVVLGGYRYSDGTVLFEDINPGYGGAYIIEMDINNFEILKRAALPASETRGDTKIHDYIEFDDFYIALGRTSGNSFEFEGLNKGGDNLTTDSFFMKFYKNDTYLAPDTNSNGVTSNVPVMQKELIYMFGGSSDDVIYDIEKISETEFIAVGYSKSRDFDMQGMNVSNENYKDAILIKFDINGNILDKKVYGGTNTDIVKSVVKLDNGDYLIVGDSFSMDKDLAPFDYGYSDAIVYRVDSNFNLVENFSIPTHLKMPRAQFVQNYGTEIPSVENRDSLKLYTTNNPAIDMGRWCTTATFLDPYSNYNNVNCITPMNSDDAVRINPNVKVELSNSFDVNTVNDNSWISLNYSFGNFGAAISISNNILTFEDGFSGSVEQAVNEGYLEPLVISGGVRSGAHFFENSFNIVKGLESGSGSTYPSSQIFIKQKGVKLTNVSFDSTHSVILNGGRFNVVEYNNFDVSIEKGI